MGRRERTLSRRSTAPSSRASASNHTPIASSNDLTRRKRTEGGCNSEGEDSLGLVHPAIATEHFNPAGAGPVYAEKQGLHFRRAVFGMVPRIQRVSQCERFCFSTASAPRARRYGARHGATNHPVRHPYSAAIQLSQLLPEPDDAQRESRDG